MPRIRPLIKYHGGKGLLQSWIRSKFITNIDAYVEPFGGAANVLLNMPESLPKIYSDIDTDVFNLLVTARDESTELCHRLSSIECLEELFLFYKNQYNSTQFRTLPTMEQAVTYFVIKRMSKGGIGKQFSQSKRFYSLGPENFHNWQTARENIPLASRVLQNVTILNKSAFETIPQFDAPNALFYLDPPYFPKSRIAKEVYNHEMSCEDHERLHELILNMKSKIAISGYHCPEYDEWFKNWNLHERVVGNNSNQTMKGHGTRKIECLWCNF